MNVTASRIELTDPKLRALCLAIALALAVPATAIAQQTTAPPQTGATTETTTEEAEPQAQPPAAATQADSEKADAEESDAEEADDDEADSGTPGELFSIEDSDEPEKLKDLIQIRSTFELGAYYVSDDSFRFGRYSGLNDQGIAALLNFDVYKRDAWDSDSARYWRLTGANLGLDSRDAAFEFGVQGKYKIRVDYDQIPNFRSESGQTIYNGAGTETLTLPSDWVGSATTAGMTKLLSSLKPFDLKTQRRRVGLGISGVLTPHWDYSAGYKHETKEGTRTFGATFGNSGGNPRAVVLPEPVDWTTQQMDASLRYTSRKFQFDVSYYVSLFSDQNTSLTWANPYTIISGWAAGSGFPTAVGQVSLPPDNQFHQLSFNGGYNFSDATRLSASFSRGRMTQNETFLPYTNIPVQAASITQPLPRDSLDGRIDTTVFNLRLSSRPSTDFSWSASYRYDDRDNQTPRDEYVYIGGDSQFQDTSVASNRRRYNEPYSFREELLKVDASYRVFENTELSAGVQRSKIDRTYAERERADEDTYNFGFRTSFSDTLNGYLRYSHAVRDGSTYVGNEPFLSGYSPGYTSTIAAGWENHPLLRRYFEANRDRDQLSAGIELSATEALALSASVDYANDDYNESEVGLIDARVETATLDAVYAPSQKWSSYAFWTYERQGSHQVGWSFAGGANQIPNSSDPRRQWFANHRDRINSSGLGFTRSLYAGRVDLGVDYLHSKSRSGIDFAVGSALLTRPLPRDISQLDSFNIHATYKLRDSFSLRMSYWYERYHSTDWAVDGVAANQLANVILLGEDSPDYRENVVSLSVLYRF
jgi:MtrB/PioB family decaheme-associated outer membrane protein